MSEKNQVSLEESDSEKYKHLFADRETIQPDDETISKIIDAEIVSSSFQDNFEIQQKKFLKNLDESVNVRKKANNFFKNKKHSAEVHEEIWKLYSKSIALAPSKSEELALAYNNRAGFLFHLNKYADCIKDIDRAVSLSSVMSLKVKLLCCKMKCCTALNDAAMKKETWKMLQSCLRLFNKEELEQVASMVRDAESELNSNNSNIGEKEKEDIPVPCKNDSLYLKFNKDEERCFTSDKNYEPGEVVLCCKPYVTSANTNKFYAYCSHCLAFTWSSVPCEKCNISMYCSEVCRDEAWTKYHAVECLIIPHLRVDNVQFFYYQMSIRAVLMGIQEYGSIAQLREGINQANQTIEKSQTFELQYESIKGNNFLSSYVLPYHCNIEFLTKYVENVCRILNIMLHTTDLFKKDSSTKTGKELATDKDVAFIASLLLKITMIAASNASHVNMGTFKCEKKKSLLSCFESRCCSRGACIMPLGTFIKNDCNPNVGRCFTSDGKMIFYASQPIKKHKQIVTSYFNTFYENDKNTRQKLLSKMYVTCTCKACSEDWPLIKTLFERYQSNSSRQNVKQNTLSQKLLPKYIELEKVIWNENYHADKKSISEVAVDLAEAVRTCLQPQFVSCILTEIFCFMFEDLYGDRDIDFPVKCQIPNSHAFDVY